MQNEKLEKALETFKFKFGDPWSIAIKKELKKLGQKSLSKADRKIKEDIVIGLIKKANNK